MKTMTQFSVLSLLLLALVLAGCSGQPKDQPKADDKKTDTDQAVGKEDARANVHKLSPEDRKLAEEQGFCPVHMNNPLGSMGVPVKVMVKGQPVFLCCDACEAKAKAHADRTLAKVQQMKEQHKEAPPK